MTRLPYIARDDLDGDGTALWDRWVGDRGDWLIGESGGLIGPFNALVRSPQITDPISRTGDLVRSESVIDPSLLQLAITVVLGHWQAEFAFGGHAAGAIRSGLDESVVDAIVAGDDPDLNDSQRIVYVAVKQLVETGQMDDDAYAGVVDLLGERGTVELVVVAGFYTFTAFTLNTFDVGPMPGLERRWPRTPG